MDLVGRFRRKILLFSAVFLIAFGVFNLSTSIFATAQAQGAATPNWVQGLVESIVEGLISVTGPIVAGAVLIATQFARKQGLRISAEAEEYFVNTAKSFVENQSRFLYKKIRDNPQHREYLAKGRIPPELGKEALENVKRELRVELQSDEFTIAARDMLDKNLETLIERYVTENKKELAEKGRRLLSELVPIAVDAALLSCSTAEEADKNKEKIIEEVLQSIGKTFDFEELLFSHDDATMRIKSELNRRIGKVR